VTTLTVAGIEVERESRKTAIAHVSIDGRDVPVPVIAINGAHDGPRVAVTGGIHGAEYVAIEAARRLGMDIDPLEVHGSLVVVPISNTTAFHARAIYTSALDTNNLNRVFPGDPNGDPSQVLADWLFRQIIAPSQFYIDMHGGDMIEALVPFVLAPRYGDAALDEQALAMARATGIPRIIHGDVSGSTCGAAAAAGIPAVLAEIGGQGVWSDDEVQAHQESTQRVLRHLGVLQGQASQTGEGQVYDVFAWMRASVSGLFHPAVTVGEQVQEGQRVGAIVDYFGNPLQELHAVTSGEIGFLVTSLAMNEGDPILAILT
jgi:predicted deacylase